MGQGRPSLTASRNRRMATEVPGRRSPSGTAEPRFVSRGPVPPHLPPCFVTAVMPKSGCLAVMGSMIHKAGRANFPVNRDNGMLASALLSMWWGPPGSRPPY